MSLSKEWAALKNGSDIRGVASEGIEGMTVNLTDETIGRIAAGFVIWVEKKLNKTDDLTLAVGHDSRISAQRIKKVCIDSFTSAGVKVLDCGLCTTPAMFMTCVDKNVNADASLMITASHLPFNRNGLKFFTASGGLESSDITEILEYAQANVHAEQSKGQVVRLDYISAYSKFILDKIISETGESKPLAGFKIALDAGNGAGGFYAKEVLEPLGADISGSVFLDPDGMFPNHVPNPEDKSAMDAISKAVIDSKSDLGIIFDTDVDRAAVVDETGREINKNRLIALISAILLEDKPGETIVTDSVTSTGLKYFIEEELKGKHHRFKRGYRNVINEAIRLNEDGISCPLAIETSGHAAMRENYFLDDGAYLVTKILIKMIRLSKEGKKLSDLIVSLKEAKISKTFRLPIKAEDFKAYGEKILKDFSDYVDNIPELTPETHNFEGVRVNCFGGWFLLRMSLHDPIMPLDLEADSEEEAYKMIKIFSGFLETYKFLDITSIL
ncbi:MAG: phosphomannomutase/phosphoglucomutase [Bacillota bacterium]|nr:phosphomannomutase/phosphoglucomutase [Bacillota bacterium]